jgi:hypothetical protein
MLIDRNAKIESMKNDFSVHVLPFRQMQGVF